MKPPLSDLDADGQTPTPAVTPPEPVVFIVDDDPAIRESLNRLLKNVGLQAKAFDSAQAFLESYDPKEWGCLVLDMCMPGMSGLELQAQLAARRNRIPIILITGYADVPMAVRALKAGVLDLLEKPFDSEVLLQRIREALALKPKTDTEQEIAPFILASMGDGVITATTAGTVEYLNPMAEHLTGWTCAQAKGKPLQDVYQVINEVSRKPVSLVKSPEGEEPGAAVEESRLVLVSRQGQEYPLEQSAAPIRDPGGAVLGTVVIFRDTTQVRTLTRQLAYQATHDPLTGLLNRREFERRLGRALANAQVSHAEHVLCYLDLDRFKAVNDGAGHAAGDHLLRQLGILLGSRLRQRDVLARLGGDEFAVLLEHCPLAQGARIANDLCQAVQNFRFTWEGQPFTIGFSIGVAPITSTSQNPGQLMQIADAACYAAKHQGGNQVYVHGEQDGEKLGTQDWITFLDSALRDHRLQLYRQAMVPAEEPDHHEHYEILLRLPGPLEDTPTAGTFIPAARRLDLAPVLGRWIIRHILKWLINNPERLARLGTCTIILSHHTLLEDRKFAAFFGQWLKSSGVPPAKLCFALSENVITGHLQEAAHLLQTLKALGCRIAVDSFACTLAGFAYLKHLSVDLLRIDGYLIKDMVDDPVAYAMVKSINEIAHAMQVQTVAKFVESQKIAKMVRALGVDYLQGHYIAEPVQIGNGE